MFGFLKNYICKHIRIYLSGFSKPLYLLYTYYIVIIRVFHNTYIDAYFGENWKYVCLKFFRFRFVKIKNGTPNLRAGPVPDRTYNF